VAAFVRIAELLPALAAPLENFVPFPRCSRRIFNSLAAARKRADKLGMNVNALPNSEAYLQSFLSSTLNGSSSTTSTSSTTGTTSSSSVSSLTMPTDSQQLSPFAQLMSTLQQLQQQNPTEHQQVTQQIATNLQTAAQTAQSQGNTAAATQLSALSTDFQNASSSGEMPSISPNLRISDLSQALSDHHPDQYFESSSDSYASSSTSSAGSATSDGTQSDALDAMSTIMSTLSSAGLGASNG
jgi:hypothetical protein